MEGVEEMLRGGSSQADWGGECVDSFLDPGIASKSYIRIKEGIPAVL
jgi:hypothetical protein